MADRWRAPGGWRVEVVHLTGTPDHNDGERLRVTQYGSWVADVRTVGELAQWFELSDLEPELVWSHSSMTSLVSMRRSSLAPEFWEESVIVTPARSGPL